MTQTPVNKCQTVMSPHVLETRAQDQGKSSCQGLLTKKHAQAAHVWFILTYIAAETSYTDRHLSTLSDDSPPRALPLPLWRALNQASPQTLQPHSRFPSPASLRVGLKAKLGAQDLRFENGMLQGKIKSVLGGR